MILEDIFLIQIIVTIVFCIVSSVFDVKKGIVPDKLNYFLVCFGIISNLILTVISTNIKFILFSIISLLITFTVTYLMWELNVWGGGDVKLLTSSASVIPFGVNIPFLNISPTLSFYPFSFTVMINSILVSFPFLLGFLIYLSVKNKFITKPDIFKGFLSHKSLKLLIDINFNRHINVKDLEEGMMINNYYFNNPGICDLIESNKDSNLKIYASNDGKSDFYFKTETAGGITEKDMYLLKIMNAQRIISNQISIKIGFPFVPSILIALLIAIFYGDLSILFLKNLVFVI